MDLQQMIHSEIVRLAKEDKLEEIAALLAAGNLGVFVQNMPAVQDAQVTNFPAVQDVKVTG